MPFPCPGIADAGTLYTLSCESESARRRAQQLMQHRRCVLVDLRPWTKTNPEWTRETLDLRYNIIEQAHLPQRCRLVRYVWDERLTCTAANLSERFEGRLLQEYIDLANARLATIQPRMWTGFSSSHPCGDLVLCRVLA